MPPVISIILMIITITLLNIVSMLKFLTKLNIVGIANINPIISIIIGDFNKFFIGNGALPDPIK